MRRAINYIMIGILSLMVLNSCRKDSKSEPTPEPEEKGLSFPKKEMRAVWIATVWGIDWPKSTAMETQKKEYTDMLDKFQDLKFNTVFVQVRGMGDAFYNSPYEPWSSTITGTRGKDPQYDVMKFMIDEAHARGLEFHAWINPYRISTRANGTDVYPPLFSAVKPEWVVDHEKIRIYNPALPEVRQRLADIVKDMVTKYNVDGIHMDDYFYPDPSSAGALKSDDAEYQQYKGNFNDIRVWRRDNVDQAINLIHKTIVETKPEVVFSISPAASMDYNFNTLYADIAKWTKSGWVDILIPQLYQEVGNQSNDYQFNLAHWSQYTYNTKLVVGHALYKFGDKTNPAAFQSVQELERQFYLAGKNKKAVGSAMYSASDVLANRIKITDKLKELYSHNAVMPFAGREVAPKPAVPTNLTLNGSELSWTVTGSNLKTVVYHFSDLKAIGKVVGVTSNLKMDVTDKGFYCVTTINVDNLESAATSTIEKK